MHLHLHQIHFNSPWGHLHLLWHNAWGECVIYKQGAVHCTGGMMRNVGMLQLGVTDRHRQSRTESLQSIWVGLRWAQRVQSDHITNLCFSLRPTPESQGRVKTCSQSQGKKPLCFTVWHVFVLLVIFIGIGYWQQESSYKHAETHISLAGSYTVHCFP